MHRSTSPLSKSQTVAEKGDHLQKELAVEQASISDSSGTQIQVKDLKESKSGEGDCAGSQSVSDKQSVTVKPVSEDEAKDSGTRNSISTDSKSLVDGQSAD
ncbi:uncharacterized protein A4U43_C09F10020 [Asparagus officinalis]|uniref:Uncharacterized protein n=1 Tax=Asparagus officinalis TaxID=4686 RepID=A0A5P1E6R4_ASPOF|nr:uncharacterized protein A4U43_C09F10020 [Asparagus officinalis]